MLIWGIVGNQLRQNVAWTWWTAAGLFGGLVLADQHRLQPWVYQITVIGLLLCSCRPELSVRLCRLVVISVYFYSAVSKVDASFLTGEGGWLLDGLCRSLGIDTTYWSETLRTGLLAVFPLGELAVAVGLFWSWTRVAAVCLAIAMHTALLLALGPWGLDHKPGVLIWNVYFAAQAYVLFLGPTRPERGFPSEPVDRPTHQASLGRNFAVTLTAIVIGLPLLEPFGLCDHWLAWELYATHPSRAVFFVSTNAREKLPADLKPFVREPPFGESWSRVEIDRWSLEAVSAPLYPQDRFQLAVAVAVTLTLGLERDARVLLQSPANRWTGERATHELIGLAAMQRAAADFRCNARPRNRWRATPAARESDGRLQSRADKSTVVTTPN